MRQKEVSRTNTGCTRECLHTGKAIRDRMTYDPIQDRDQGNDPDHDPDRGHVRVLIRDPDQEHAPVTAATHAPDDQEIDPTQDRDHVQDPGRDHDQRAVKLNIVHAPIVARSRGTEQNVLVRSQDRQLKQNCTRPVRNPNVRDPDQDHDIEHVPEQDRNRNQKPDQNGQRPSP